MRILNQMGPQVGAVVASALPHVEVEAVPLDGPVDPDLKGDALLSFRRASTMVEVARHVPWLHIAGAGVEGLDPTVFEDDRVVTCSRGAHAIPIAEFVMAAIIAFEHRAPALWIRDAPAGSWMPLDELESRIDVGELRPPDAPVDVAPDRWGFMWTGEMAGRTVGLVGLGGIGAAVARRALAFDMDVVAVRRRLAPSPVDGVRLTTSLEEVLGAADHIVVCAPATPQTDDMIDAAALAHVRPGAHLVNVARGSLVDEDALVDALDSGRLAMASLDVAKGEPLAAGHRFFDHPRVRLSPHVSWTSPRRQERVIDVFVDNVRRRERGERMVGVVDPAQGY